MKLRIRGDSVRLRLTRPEVEALDATGVVEERTRFPGARALVYRLQVDDNTEMPTASLDASTVVVRLSRAMAVRWCRGPDVGIEADQPLTGGGSLRLTIEKDFECLDRPQESEEGAYPNPARGGACGPAT